MACLNMKQGRIFWPDMDKINIVKGWGFINCKGPCEMVFNADAFKESTVSCRLKVCVIYDVWSKSNGTFAMVTELKYAEWSHLESFDLLNPIMHAH